MISPDDHKEMVMSTADVYLSTLRNYINGAGSLSYNYTFTNRDIIEEQILTLMENIAAGRVVRKPKLKLVS